MARAGLTDLMGPRWVLEELDGTKMPGSDQEAPFMILSEGEGGRVNGFAGCNRFFGAVEVDLEEGRMSFHQIGSTRMMCPEMEVEVRFLRALERLDRFRLEAGLLKLYQDDRVRMVFRAQADEDAP